jgi:hypothetical protein
MKRALTTTAFFILALLTIVALTVIGTPQGASGALTLDTAAADPR